MKLNRRKRLLFFSAVFAVIYTSAAFASDNRVMASVTERGSIIARTGSSGGGEVFSPDQTMSGSVTIRLIDTQEDAQNDNEKADNEKGKNEKGGNGKVEKEKGGIRFYCMKTADIEAGKYVLQERWKDVQVDLNELENASDLKSAAEKMAEKASEILSVKQTEKQTGIQEAGDLTAITDSSGQVIFSDLKTGVYLICAENTEKYDIIEPSLIAVPTWSEKEGQMQYDVVVEPKHSEKQEKSESEPEPEPGTPKSSAPQTGIQDYTLCYLAGGAGCVMLAGALVAADKNKKKKDGR